MVTGDWELLESDEPLPQFWKANINPRPTIEIKKIGFLDTDYIIGLNIGFFRSIKIAIGHSFFHSGAGVSVVLFNLNGKTSKKAPP